MEPEHARELLARERKRIEEGLVGYAPQASDEPTTTNQHLADQASDLYDAARRRGVEVAAKPLGVERLHFELDAVRRQVVRQRCRDRPETFAEREPHRELFVVARRAHRDRDRLATDPDLERLFDRDEVLLSYATARVDVVRVPG